MSGKRASRQARGRSATGARRHVPPRRWRPPRMLGWAGVVCLGVAAALSYAWWHARGHSHFEMAIAGDEPRLAPGDPPLDAAAVLQVSPDPPETVAEMNEESLAVGALVVRTLPDRPEAHAQMAFARLQVGLDRAAVESWEQAVETDPAFADGYLGLGGVLKELGENERAIAAFRRAIELNPEIEAAYRELSEALLRERGAEEALEVARECVRRFPGDAEHHFWEGQARLQLDDYAGARLSHERAIRIDPDYTQSYHPLAIACARLGDKEQAKRYQQRFAVLKAAELEADRTKTRAYDDLAKHRQALTKRHVVAGVLQFQVGDPRLAEAHWLRAAVIDPGELATRKALATLYEQQQRAAAAVRFLEELSRLEPEEPEHFLRMGRLMVGLGWDPQGQQALERVLELAPDTVEAHLLLAQVHLRAGSNLPAAVAHAERAVSLTPSPEGFMVLAAARATCGDLTGARSALKQAASLDPGNPNIRRAYEQIRAVE